MYTHCPNCNTHFEITQEDLDIAHGKVRCGQCDHIFNALENLYNKNTSQLTTEHSEITQDTALTSESSSSNQPETREFSPPNTDIKEKMERIVASLSAATEELKNARKASSFQKPAVEKTFEPIETPQADETAKTDKSLLDEEILLQAEDTLLADELQQIEDSLTIDKVPYAEDAVKTDETTQTEDTFEIDETAPTEDVLEIDETAAAVDDNLDINETTAIEDELEIVNFSEDELTPTSSPSLTDFSAHQVDQNDIDIFNSLMDNSEKNAPDNDLHDELDDINKTLSDVSNSLDDEFSSLDDEFDQLDNDDDLLAELEQLESDFLDNTQTSVKDDTHTESVSLADDISLENKSSAESSTQDSENEPSQAVPVQDEVVPSFLTQTDSASSSPAAILGWLASTVVLLLLLASQYLHFNSIQLSQDPEIRPLLESLCPLTNCSLPLISTPRKVVTVTHDVRTHPTVNNALEIQLTFKNKASYTQSYPVLEITFSNPVGEIIARRKFLPNEYMKNNSTYTSGLKSNQSQEINLDIVDPDPGSLLSFQFNYL
ncbi:MAG: zinc-ribbon domain-containing protein [gamma proteobacterium symbiont of Bathyaustriella thionipta]|nr:zinc-ribbon domain-containing protein [gamma proteobacterium symbiont of Bathyaustriella thionipta]MCU7948761.1 zinc-ribbon domain-containing protein [gamma proteobacterium symbiont of Bathyaustriella thionipta]MCU7953543.1 zinc-ribbon domain-containing protein [gamma proteobacterium symbiont of Bathyaustriella thionipta]MCU7955244.1 zinc-ribbon domain-containing protein [gamma proteobacterium symbiont of Bathyaustriella thionipta]MCU7965994.1 zinc-ribbon domain-containing protein [gamma pro